MDKCGPGPCCLHCLSLPAHLPATCGSAPRLAVPRAEDKPGKSWPQAQGQGRSHQLSSEMSRGLQRPGWGCCQPGEGAVNLGRLGKHVARGQHEGHPEEARPLADMPAKPTEGAAWGGGAISQHSWSETLTGKHDKHDPSGSLGVGRSGAPSQPHTSCLPSDPWPHKTKAPRSSASAWGRAAGTVRPAWSPSVLGGCLFRCWTSSRCPGLPKPSGTSSNCILQSETSSTCCTSSKPATGVRLPGSVQREGQWPTAALSRRSVYV